jgi:hypothetical protein
LLSVTLLAKKQFLCLELFFVCLVALQFWARNFYADFSRFMKEQLRCLSIDVDHLNSTTTHASAASFLVLPLQPVLIAMNVRRFENTGAFSPTHGPPPTARLKTSVSL